MKILRLIVCILTVAVIATQIGLSLTHSNKDVKPEIICDADKIEVKCDSTDEEILKGVRAFDQQDGNITDGLFVEKLLYMTNKNESEVTFVSIDSDNNVSKLTKKIVYTDYEPPKITLMSDMVFERTSLLNVTQYIKAYDVIDGDISSHVRLVSSDANANIPGEYILHAKVSNSFGDTAELDFKLRILSVAYPQNITLNSYVAYFNVGDTPDFSSYIISGNKSNVKIDSSGVDMTKPGTYDVTYTIGSKENPSAFSHLIVIVR